MKYYLNVRRKDREITDKSEIKALVGKAKILRLGLFDGKYPYIVPMHFGFEYDEAKDGYVFYMHCANVGRKLDIINNNPSVCIELEAETKLSGFGDNACEYSAYYASFIGFGQAGVVRDIAEKKRALALLMINQTDKNFDFTDKMAEGVGIIKVEVSEYTSKSKKKPR